MLITIDKDILVSVLQDQIKNWEEIGGGANYDAFEFDPKKVNKQQKLTNKNNKKTQQTTTKKKLIKKCCLIVVSLL